LRRAGGGGGTRGGGAGAIGGGSSTLEAGGSSGAIIGSGSVGGGSALSAGVSALEASDEVAAPALFGAVTSRLELEERFAAKMSGLPASSSAETCAIVAASPSSVLGGSWFAGGWPEPLFLVLGMATSLTLDSAGAPH